VRNRAGNLDAQQSSDAEEEAKGACHKATDYEDANVPDIDGTVDCVGCEQVEHAPRLSLENNKGRDKDRRA